MSPEIYIATAISTKLLVASEKHRNLVKTLAAGQFRHSDRWGDIIRISCIPVAKDRAGGRREEAVAAQREGVATLTKCLA